MNDQVEDFFQGQLAVWSQARANFSALSGVRTKEVIVGGFLYRLQYNPGRRVSATANIDPAALAARPCFLCNRPPEQTQIRVLGRYDLLVNPFPVFERHLTIADTTHTLQTIKGRFGDMLDLAEYLDDYVVFYNGPKCGASAPDHMHFQAGKRGDIPLETHWRSVTTEPIAHLQNATIILQSNNRTDMLARFDELFPNMTGDEPMMNLLVWREGDMWVCAVFKRKKYRPSCYPNPLISPGALEMAGLVITPREEDFESVSTKDIDNIIKEVGPS